jgi:hypothetical protein
MQQGSLPQFLSAESAAPQQLQQKCGVMRHKCGAMPRSAEWCGKAWNMAFCRNVQSFAALCGLFAYSADLPHMARCLNPWIVKLDCGESLPGCIKYDQRMQIAFSVEKIACRHSQ